MIKDLPNHVTIEGKHYMCLTLFLIQTDSSQLFPAYVSNHTLNRIGITQHLQDQNYLLECFSSNTMYTDYSNSSHLGALRKYINADHNGSVFTSGSKGVTTQTIVVNCVDKINYF